ncbi:SH2 domain-containing adapter protein B isoform X2 [Gopherus flavomarginatus]|uniref:SH2 domain-containing adapter protein B isoform X2 n=1 Tax=Gopherus flavomarginatus TaxID=286002 RepID=UPI0021CBE6C0|nr:SH2 domain-containing adapter protein B isoform X2 [Gopherus flavomarginatus]
MAKWLTKYFSLGNNKAKSPPQPPRPDYRERRPGAELLAAHRHTSPRLAPRHLCDDPGELLRAYRAQKERDFEDPYSGPGSSLRKLRALCRPEPCAPEEPAAGSPHLFRSQSERRPPTPPDGRYLSPKHRLIKIDSGCEGAGGCKGAAAPAITWSPPACGGEKDLLKCLLRSSEESGPGHQLPGDRVLIADDYSDPFDAKSELNKAVKGENTGYMEPYEAQRIMSEFQRQESVKSQQKGIQLYDTPYEPEGNGVESDTDSLVSQRLRESKLPQDDDRPADEYDQPWEWNKVTIPALAAQFNGNEKRQSSPSPSSDRRRQLRAPGGGFKPIKHGSPEFCGILGERVDPTVPLEKQIWYHGAISRTDAENLLRLCKECSYLVRNSQTSKHDYSLSLKSSQGFMHMKLTKTKEKYILGQNSPPFDSVPEVIHYYTTKKLPIKGAEHLSLLYPVAVRTL